MYVDRGCDAAVRAERSDRTASILSRLFKGEHAAQPIRAVIRRVCGTHTAPVDMPNKFHEIAFTDAVKAVQVKLGTRRHYEKLESRADSNFAIADAEADFIESRDGFYIATANEDGQPYIQFRGGRPGFLKVIDRRTVAYADFRGNLQYISVGNASVNNKVALFLMDYANRRRLKMLGEIEFFNVSDRPELTAKLADTTYDAKVERAAIIHVKGLEWNCPQHITPRYTTDEVKVMIQPLYEHIESLESELAKYKGESSEKVY